ncbi:MAG: uracil-DNA glycosylase family protein [Capsulimonadaceae bacterium]
MPRVIYENPGAGGYNDAMAEDWIAPETHLEIEVLHKAIRACRRCQIDGYPILPPPIAEGQAPAPFLVIGQAPSLSDLQCERMYTGPAGRKLLDWLVEAGFAETDFGSTVYLTALTLCFPGRLPGKSTDRAPSARELSHCRPWLDSAWRLVRPRAVLLFGKMAIDAFLPGATMVTPAPVEEAPVCRKPLSLDAVIGKSFEKAGIAYVPLPHSSGASTWLNAPAHRALLADAIDRVRELRRQILGEA